MSVGLILTIDGERVTDYERHVLSITQIAVLAAMRQFRTRQRVSHFFGRDEKSIDMVLTRIREKGVIV
jgi:hypothetical protein